VLLLRKDGHGEAEIMRRTGFSRCFVRRWMSASDQHEDASDRPRSGRPRKLVPPVTRLVRAHMKGKKGRSSRKVAQIMAARDNINLSYRSVQRAARLAGLSPYHRAKKPLLTDRMRERRMDFAQRYRQTNWRQVLFTDEKTFVLFGRRNRQNDVIWETSPENVPPTQAPKHPSKVHVWGGVSYYGKTDLYVFEDILDADLYIKILDRRLGDVGDMFPGGVWMLQQDGDPKHTSKKARRWLDANIPSYIPKEDWPPNSPDANVIEALWAVLQDKVYAREPRTLAGLKRIIVEEWNRIELNTLRKLVNSMPARLDAIIAAEGGHTKY
jgi:transposase